MSMRTKTVTVAYSEPADAVRAVLNRIMELSEPATWRAHDDVDKLRRIYNLAQALDAAVRAMKNPA